MFNRRGIHRLATHSLACQANSLHAVASVSLLTDAAHWAIEHFTLPRLRGTINCEHHDKMNRPQLTARKITLSLSPGPKKRGFGTSINKHARASHIQLKTEKSASLHDFIKHLYTIRRNSEQGKYMKHVNHGINLNSSCTAPLLSHSKRSTILTAERGGGMYSSDLEL